MSPIGQGGRDDADRKIFDPEMQVFFSVYFSVVHRMKLYCDELDGVASELLLETCPVEERPKYLDKLRDLSLVHPERFSNDYFHSFSGLPTSWVAIDGIASSIPEPIRTARRRLESLAGAGFHEHRAEFREISKDLIDLAGELGKALEKK